MFYFLNVYMHSEKIKNITSEMDSPSWKTLKKRYYTTLYVIEITG